jgi:hypothetical protein
MKGKTIHSPLFLFLVLVSLLWVPFAAAQAPEGQEYVVQAEDWLSKIAEKAYGDPLAFPSIVEATNAKAAEDDTFALINNPDIIEIGQKLWLPATPEDSGDTMAPPEAVTETETPEPQFVDFNPDNFDNSTTIDNEWYPLQPGTHLVYEGTTTEDGESFPHRLEFTVTDLTKEIEGVQTVVAWIEDYSDGELVELEVAFYAQDNDGNVWYLGEYPEEFEDGQFVAAPTWIAGFEEARAGIKMQADPQPGTPSYFQGWGPAVDWSDYGQVDQVGQETCVPVDCYQDVLVIAESSLGEADAFQLKYYAPGVGEVRVGWRGADATQEELELIELEQLDPEALAEVGAMALLFEKHAYQRSKDVYAHTSPMEHAPGAE